MDSIILFYCMGDTVLEGKDAESIRNASERIAKVLGEVDIEHTVATDDYCMVILFTESLLLFIFAAVWLIFTAFLRFMTPK
jgi:hypothetical protein